MEDRLIHAPLTPEALAACRLVHAWVDEWGFAAVDVRQWAGRFRPDIPLAKAKEHWRVARNNLRTHFRGLTITEPHATRPQALCVRMTPEALGKADAWSGAVVDSPNAGPYGVGLLYERAGRVYLGVPSDKFIEGTDRLIGAREGRWVEGGGSGFKHIRNAGLTRLLDAWDITCEALDAFTGRWFLPDAATLEHWRKTRGQHGGGNGGHGGR